jgi:very-short-patch-repair endonuclease
VPTLLERRRQLRTDATDAEGLIWQHLRGRRFQGFKFRRQHPIGPYILDFFCPLRGVAIELDGGQHFEIAAQAYDQRRTDFLSGHGICVLRFNNDLVFLETEAVLEVIAHAVDGDPSPQPSPRRTGARGKAGAVGGDPSPQPSPRRTGARGKRR